jgi:hypothetical protein
MDPLTTSTGTVSSKISHEASGLLKDPVEQVLTDYFRCPKGIVDFRLQKERSGQRGYFRFGSDVVCFGKLFSGNALDKPLDSTEDVLKYVRSEEGTVRLPFDPNEVIQNLTYERYTRDPDESKRKLSFRKAIRKAYYFVRPVLPLAVRTPLQRFRLRNWHKTKFPRWPVDRTVDILVRKLLALGMKARGIKELPFIWFWPDDAESCAIVTHDVETAAGRNFCAKLMDIDDSFGIKSAFNVIPESRYSVSPEFISTVRNRGFELNVHDLNHDGHLFEDRMEFLRRAKRINTYAKQFKSSGFRSGALYRNQDWFDAFDFSYDMSVPNVAHLDPQEGGCCMVMPYFIGHILELPLTTTQDHTLFHILDQYSIDLWEQQMRLILKANGMISFIVHPDYILRGRAQDTYKALLANLCRLREEAGVWIALPGEVNQWWRTRNKLELVHQGGLWRVDGEGKERARVAYAVLDDTDDTVKCHL